MVQENYIFYEICINGLWFSAIFEFPHDQGILVAKKYNLKIKTVVKPKIKQRF